ncbi:hypothetical protein J5N97_027947 [Dioscorea zingiberensis]|uniref:AAA-type ATPase N-terminal domain-containing protein n=1 Tax=Dioscorea zingiberensis TaxID=325984 RepID=A0A9D5BY64_9LILI|nr:hypothetical protein J5N97_027947 [Dioscorea zingiberensis]
MFEARFIRTSGGTDTLVRFTTAISMVATAVFVRTFASNIIPQSLQCYLSDSLSALFTRFSSQITIAIDEFENRNPNRLFKAAETYLGTKASSSTRKLRASKQDDENAIEVSIDFGEEVIDVFLGFEFRWRLVSRESNTPSEARSFQLSFHKKNKELALSTYLPHVLDQAKAIKDKAKTKTLKLLED